MSTPCTKKRSRAANSLLLLLLLVDPTTMLGVATGRSGHGGLFERCSNEKSAFDCLKRRALEILDSAIRDNSVYAINDYISIGRDPASSASPARTFGDVDGPKNVTERSLDEQLDDKFYEYLSSRSIRLTIPGNTFEGRKKKEKGNNGLLLYGLALAGMMAQLAYGKIAFLAGTALLTAKIALVLSAIIGLKKLVSSGGGGHEVIYATASEHHGGYGGGYGGGWQRALEGAPPT